MLQSCLVAMSAGALLHVAKAHEEDPSHVSCVAIATIAVLGGPCVF